MIRDPRRPPRVDPDYALRGQAPSASDAAVREGIEQAYRERRRRLVGTVKKCDMPDPAEIRRAILGQPFRSFQITTVTGCTWKVWTVDTVALSPDGHRLAVFGDDGRPHLLRTCRITRIAPLRRAYTRPAES
jgi:hypothetical protein